MDAASRAFIVLRFSLALFFLWFAFQQLTDSAAWVGYLPVWTGYLPIPGEMLVMLHGWAELVLAILLALGIFTRMVAILLALHLFTIAWTVGGPVGMRDGTLGMSLVALAIGPLDNA